MLGRVLLTGGAGFIGSHVAEALLRRGSSLTIVDNLDSFYSPETKRANLEEVRRLGRFAFHQADIRDRFAMRRIFSSSRPQAVIHLAARPGVRTSFVEPELYEQVNVGGTTCLLECAREIGVRKFVFGSSSSVYGDSPQLPFCERQPELKPISPYACTKLAAELECRRFSESSGMPVICLRFFTVYGARQRPDLAIHKFTALLEAGLPLPVYGDGCSGRDYTYIDDVVAGVLAALDYPASPAAGSGPFEIFNLGNSCPVALNELISMLENATGRRARRDPHPAPPGDVLLTWADVSKASSLLDYRPVTSLQEGLRRFMDWYRASTATRGIGVVA
ncbi:MAG TPA: GDP-mannose 4,6-dehydratase [Patescibacteria group bacterium]|nr:GDP-mannose 4,6-dehydratase [Patescibacteria group bacterium]